MAIFDGHCQVNMRHDLPKDIDSSGDREDYAVGVRRKRNRKTNCLFTLADCSQSLRTTRYYWEICDILLTVVCNGHESNDMTWQRELFECQNRVNGAPDSSGLPKTRQHFGPPRRHARHGAFVLRPHLDEPRPSHPRFHPRLSRSLRTILPQMPHKTK